MTALARGANTGLPTGANAIRLLVGWQPGSAVQPDASALLVKADGKVRGDADFIFYNQPSAPDGSTAYEGGQGQQSLLVTLDKVPPEIEKVRLTASTDGQPFSQIPGLHVRVLDAMTNADIARYDVQPGDVSGETALVLGELYRRQGQWKFRAVGQGWASGLAGIATDHGLTVADTPAPAPAAPPSPPAPPPQQQAPPMPQQAPPMPQQTPPPGPPMPPAPPSAAPGPPPGAPAPASGGGVSFEKLEREAPQLVSLAKKAQVSLEKRGLGGHQAKVALCLDVSYSMQPLYARGKVQMLAERVLALATRFDDDGAIDVFTFGERASSVGEMGLNDFQGYTDKLLDKLEYDTNYGLAMELIRKHYFPDGGGGKRNSPVSAQLPVYVMFVTDGQTSSPKQAVQQITHGSYEPIFWQFMAIGGGRRGQFEFLEKLDDLTDRFVDNANFFAVQPSLDVPDEELYDKMMAEYPGWIQLVKQRGMLP